jgi:hypothetical protein
MYTCGISLAKPCDTVHTAYALVAVLISGSSQPSEETAAMA